VTTPLFSDAASLQAEIADALLVAALPAVVKATYRDLAKAAGTDVAKLDALLTKIRNRGYTDGAA
jgi:hypothetical protein